MLSLNKIKITQGAFELKAHFDVDAGQNVAVVGPSGAGDLCPVHFPSVAYPGGTVRLFSRIKRK